MQLSEKLSEKYNIISDFLTSNKLKVNDDKTQLLVLTSRQKRQHVDLSNIIITTPTATVRPSKVERLLGAHVHEVMRWKEHIMDNEESLKKVCRLASFKSRKMLANGVFMCSCQSGLDVRTI